MSDRPSAGPTARASDGVLLALDDGGVRTLLLNRPDRRNALDRGLVEALHRELEAAGEDPGVRVVVLRGAGQDFCSGADLSELHRFAEEGAEAGREDAARLGGVFRRMRHLPKPVVAAVHGRALAGGAGLATACDLVLLRDDAELGYPEVHLAFVPAMVMAILRRRVPEHVAFELVAFGDRIGAEEALRIGLVNRVFPADGFDEEVSRYAAALAERPTSSIALSKGLLHELDDLGFDQGIERGVEVNVQARSTDECRARVDRFLSRKSDSS